MLKKFQDFAIKGNAVDLAIGVIIGAAFGQIVASMVGDIIMPLVGAVRFGVHASAAHVGAALQVSDARHVPVVLPLGVKPALQL